MLRALGYSTLVSMESFRKPNFPLVADLLVWLAKRFDPDIDIPLEIATEDERVKLIHSAAQFMALKANVKLNTKRLYQADGYAVKELLKITTLLYDALNIDVEETEEDRLDHDSFNLRDFDITDKVSELKLSRLLASEITSTGASLFDLLGKEVDLRTARQRSVARQFELSDVETGIKKAMEAISEELTETKQLIENVAATEASLDSKIERRKVEIDRYEKRLQTLKKVRPAFLEEFTALEEELEQLFVQYSVRLRCLNQLEKQFSDSERNQIEKQLQLTSPRIETIPLEKVDENDLFLEKDDGLERSGAVNRQERPRASTGGRHRPEKGAKAYGGMQPPLSGSQSSLDLSTDSESDDLFIDKDEPELMHSDEESLALELSVDRRAPSGRKTSSKVQENNSDDDF
ncbi:clusterin-associated protein 1 homolog [Anoplophora glabripennis]|uniref:clusterin-associated protein 1 homolog n=1 Tax=Anoplophora glabripennis TaxID=217634 RepID=UPI00087402A1|nr:clusterin-associated protein 1 homolog [Anoplophora glabripennis]